ncbi:hypothetical protein Taro_043325, partial [Colocasia esculenta]|nr:hypothetical protein [Colocasia esculenta]
DIDDFPYDHDIAYGLYDNISLCDDALHAEEVDPKELPSKIEPYKKMIMMMMMRRRRRKRKKKKKKKKKLKLGMNEVWLTEVDQLEDAKVHASFRGITFLLLLRLLPPVAHALLMGIALLLLRLLLSEIYILHTFYSFTLCSGALPSSSYYGSFHQRFTLYTGHHPPPPTMAPSIKVHTPLRGTALPLLLRLLPSEFTYRFATAKQEEDAKIAWDKVAGRRFSDYLTKKKELAKRAVDGGG